MQPEATKQTVERIEAYLAALNSGDTETMLACLHEDLVHDINQAGREIGRKTYRWHVGEMRRYFREQITNVLIMASRSGSRASAEFTRQGTYISTMPGEPAAKGQKYFLSAAMFFEIDDGLISRITEYSNLTEWRRQIRTDR